MTSWLGTGNSLTFFYSVCSVTDSTATMILSTKAFFGNASKCCLLFFYIFVASIAQIYELTSSLRFMDIILRVLRLEVSINNVYITNQFQTNFEGGGGVQSFSRGRKEEFGLWIQSLRRWERLQERIGKHRLRLAS